VKGKALFLTAALATALLWGGRGALAAGRPAPAKAEAKTQVKVRIKDGFVSDVARHLGVPERKLKAAITQARLDHVQELLGSGRITKEQAAEMRQRIQSGAPMLGVHHHLGPASSMLQDAATYLGIAPQDLLAQLAQGKTAADVATAQGKTPQALEQALRDASHQRIAALVQQGHLTPSRAARVQAHLQERIHAFVTRSWAASTPWGPMRGRSAKSVD